MRVLIVPNSSNPAAVASARSLAEWLQRRGDAAVLATDDAEACGVPELAVAADAQGRVDLVTALGGDGTILKAVHLLSDRSVPILGVNLGKLGFLCGADGSELPEAVAEALEGRGVTDRRCTLRVHATAGGRGVGTHQALNEVYVGRGPGGRAVDVCVSVDGEPLMRSVCDGVIIASPTGSTAYALSAGGPIVSPSLRAMIVVLAGAHTLANRPVVLDGSVAVTIGFPDEARSDACLTVDGEPVPCRTGLDEVTVRLDDQDISLVRRDGRGFHRTLAASFFGV